MGRLVYVEEAISDHPRTRAILDRLPDATRVGCRHYGEVFNPRAQNFRLQKRRPALILAAKRSPYVQAAPAEYAIGAERNFYFSTMLNCPYDCRYCFLQGMYRSAHHVLFVNYEDFSVALQDLIDSHADSAVHLFSGYDADSLAYDAVSGFCDHFLPFFARQRPDVLLELRTKSCHIAPLLRRPADPHCLVAFSFTPPNVAQNHEHGVPPIDRRIAAMAQLQAAGWRVALRLDPLIHHDGFAEQYTELCNRIFAEIDGSQIHSVSIGAFRMPTGFFRTLRGLYPDEALFTNRLVRHQSMVSYPARLADDMIAVCHRLISRHVPEERIHSCLKRPRPPEPC